MRGKDATFSLHKPHDITETLQYLETYKPAIMASFARFVINEGHGAKTPGRYVDGKFVVETWQECGRRLFGKEAFSKAMKAELQKLKEEKLGSNNEDQEPDF